MFYEFVTSGAVPYGDLTNPQTKLHVGNGYRLPQAQDCPDEFHSLMLKCWAKVPGSRPGFPAIVSDLAKDRQKFVGLVIDCCDLRVEVAFSRPTNSCALRGLFEVRDF